MQSYGPLGEPQKLVEVQPDPEVSPSRFLPAPAHRLVVLPSATEASPLVPPMLPDAPPADPPATDVSGGGGFPLRNCL